MEFEFATAQKIIFGPGAIGKLGVYAAEMGRCALVATNLPEAKTGTVFALLSAHHIAYRQFVVEGEPTIESVTGAIEAARHEGCDLFIGLGGGSALDTAKAAAALAANPGDLLGYLEVVGRGQPLLAPAFPVVAIPTTSGTGAEVTRNAVIGSPQHEVKVSLRSPWMLPRLALVDPNLTRGLPQDVTASTGMDALTQLIEPFLSSRANPIADAFCREGLPRAARSIRAAYERDDPAAREQMALASLLGGLALANAGLGVVHGFASVLGGMLKAPHGAVCAALLPHALRLTTLLCRGSRNWPGFSWGGDSLRWTGSPGWKPSAGR
jgi:alcohol dehydrogenase class IV